MNRVKRLLAVFMVLVLLLSPVIPVRGDAAKLVTRPKQAGRLMMESGLVC